MVTWNCVLKNTTVTVNCVVLNWQFQFEQNFYFVERVNNVAEATIFLEDDKANDSIEQYFQLINN